MNLTNAKYTPKRVPELASSTPTVTQARKLKTGSTSLTAKQAQTLSALRACAKKYGVGPTRSELKKGDWSSCFTNYKAGQALEGVRREAVGRCP